MDVGVHTVFTMFGLPITNAVVMSWIAMAVIILWAFISTRNWKIVPKGMQNVTEIFVDFANDFCVKQIGKHGRAFAPYIGTVGLFLLVANTIGALFMGELTNGLIAPPARSFGVAVALALMTITLVIGSTIYYKGFIGFIKSLFEPLPFLFPFNLLDFIIKPLSLSMRLFGNILGAYILMELLFKSLPFAASFASIYFDLFDGGLQAFIFVFLSALYIEEGVNEEND